MRLFVLLTKFTGIHKEIYTRSTGNTRKPKCGMKANNAVLLSEGEQKDNMDWG